MTRRLVLALDSATESCTAALLAVAADEGGVGEPLEVVAARREEALVARGGGILLPLVQEILLEAGASQVDVAAVVAGEGPGTFTGVRVAVATARAVSLALGVPIYGRSTLSALAALVLGEAGASERAAWPVVVPMVDARRGQVFAAVYARRGSVWAEVGDLLAVAPEELMPAVNAVLARREVGEGRRGGSETVLLTGTPALLGRVVDPYGTAQRRARAVDAIGLVRGQGWLEGGKAVWEGLVDAVAGWGGWGTHRPGRAGSPELVRPIYVRAPDADIHITKMKDPWA